MGTSTKKYTLSLPEEIYNDLQEKADRYDTSIKNMVRQCLKFGLIGIEVNEDPDSDIIFRERVRTNGQVETRDTHVKFVI